MKLTLEQIALWTHADSLLRHDGGRTVAATGYSIDTRTLAPGDLFFAVRGERFDAHDFVPQALAGGACAAVIASARAPELTAARATAPLLVVEDPLCALQDLARAVRQHWGKRVIGITGSAGKTTTKEAVAAVLGSRFHVLKSRGNLNNGYGLPLQLLKLEAEDEIAVIEMGMSAAGEIAALSAIARPDWGLVTNVGMAHAENFPDGILGIARAKGELIDSLPPSGIAFLNADDQHVSAFGRARGGRTVRFGFTAAADVRAEAIEQCGPAGMRFRAVAGSETTEVKLSLLGQHNITNALAAIGVGLESGIPLAACAEAVGGLQSQDRRGEVIERNGAQIINDCYNSNPEALKSMIRTLAAVPAERRILVAGEMLELGSAAEELHRECGRTAGEAGIDIVLGVRGRGAAIVRGASETGAEAHYLQTPGEAGAWLKKNLRRGDAVLLKASRGVRLEGALDALGPAPQAGKQHA